MPDLQDGQSVQIQGSARNPYIIKNVAGVYSCSCPAWRNQSLKIDRRTCKHIIGLRGEQAEAERVAATVNTPALAASTKAAAPPVLLAQSWDNDRDLTGWHISEKLDGVRAWWDGKRLVSRQGNPFFAPDWFTAGFPKDVTLDGELWLGRKCFQRTVSIVRRQDGGELWRELKFAAFDAPSVSGPFEERQRILTELVDCRKDVPFAHLVNQEPCRGIDHIRQRLDQVISLGGEGLMLRQPGSLYSAGRSNSLLKVKLFHDAEATVVEHLPGTGRHRGRLGALAVELPNGTRFSVGTGLSDKQRENPPPVGSVITFRYQEWTDGGVPRFPSFVRVR